jgi:hypothetical protein
LGLKFYVGKFRKNFAEMPGGPVIFRIDSFLKFALIGSILLAYLTSAHAQQAPNTAFGVVQDFITDDGITQKFYCTEGPNAIYGVVDIPGQICAGAPGGEAVPKISMCTEDVICSGVTTDTYAAIKAETLKNMTDADRTKFIAAQANMTDAQKFDFTRPTEPQVSAYYVNHKADAVWQRGMLACEKVADAVSGKSNCPIPEDCKIKGRRRFIAPASGGVSAHDSLKIQEVMDQNNNGTQEVFPAGKALLGK